MARPEIQYCATKDGASIAYYTMGEGPPLVIVSNVLWGHLRIQVMPEYHRSGGGLGRCNRIVRYDSRGTGLSDRTTLDYSLDARIADLEAVVDHLGLARFDLAGFVHGGTGAIAYAVRHPDRVSHLVLGRAYASGPEFLSRASNFEPLRTTMMDEDWERFTLLMANTNTGFADSNLARRMAVLYRESMTPEGVRAFWKAMETIDVRPLLEEVRVPTLVVRGGGRPAPMGRGDWVREIAAKIPGARLVETSGDASSPSEWGDHAIRAIEEFLGVDAEKPRTGAPDVPSATAVILFADIADSTALTERLGDADFRAKARELDGALRSIVREYSGTPIEGKLLGDGVLAVFTSARQAIEAALACARGGASAGMPLHLGLHAGDIIREEGNVYGGAVNIASRISGLAAPGEVLVSETVRSLARTSAGAAFEDRGDQQLKGVSDVVGVWAVMSLDTSRVSELPRGREPAYPDHLTAREVEVLRLIAAGRTNLEISAELVLSLRTVARHITNIYGKIGARSKVDAASYAMRHNLTVEK